MTLEACPQKLGCALTPGHTGECVVAILCGVDPDMTDEQRTALDDVLRAAAGQLQELGPHPNA